MRRRDLPVDPVAINDAIERRVRPSLQTGGSWNDVLMSRSDGNEERCQC
jgi:hypothetical protein